MLQKLGKRASLEVWRWRAVATAILPHLLKRVIAQGRAKSRASCVTRHGRGTRHGRVAIDWPPLGRNGAPPVTNAAVFTTVFRHEAGGD